MIDYDFTVEIRLDDRHNTGQMDDVLQLLAVPEAATGTTAGQHTVNRVPLACLDWRRIGVRTVNGGQRTRRGLESLAWG